MLWKGILLFCVVLVSISWVSAKPALEDTNAAEYCPDLCKCADHGAETWDCKGLTSYKQICICSMTDSKLTVSDVKSSARNVRHLQLRDSHINFEFRNINIFTALKTIEFLKSPIECSQTTLWLLNVIHLTGNVTNENCSAPETLKGTPVAKAMHLIRQVNSQCPERCSCELYYVPHDDQYVTVTINCTSQGFIDFPKTLPSNFTINLDLSNNRIDDLSELVTNPSYSRVKSLYLNNNRIKTISPLESSDWIKHFTLLSLQGNELQEIPTKALTTGFQDQDGFRLFLSNNPWRCDCFTVTNFQSFVAKHTQVIKDISNVNCGPNEGENADKKIVAVETSSVCWNPDANAISLMDILNVVLALLTVSTIGKLLYDYYAYRKTGRLPWLVSKMP